MNFMDKTKVLEFDDIHVFLNTWIKRRLEIYQRRKEAVLLEMVK